MLNRLLNKLINYNVFFKIGILCSILLVGAGCSSQNNEMVSNQKVQANSVIVEKNEKIIDKKSVQSIEEVLKSEFTSPKQKYNKIIQNPKNLTNIDGNIAVKASNGSELYKYVEGLYQPYFTQSGFEKFFMSTAFNYTLQSKDIHIKVDDIAIKKNKDNEEKFNFVVKVKYKKDGNDEKRYNIKGVATLPESGKISEIKYFDDGGLMDKIRKNS